MALYRSKLGPVGGGSDGGTGEGGIVVDLDPLSAFALMGGGGGAEADSGPRSPKSEGTRIQAAARSTGGATHPPRKEHSASPVLEDRRSRDKPPPAGSWRVSDLSVVVPPQSQPQPPDAVEIMGYPSTAPLAPTNPATPANLPTTRRMPSIATPSPPRQLRALGEPLQLNSWKAGGLKPALSVVEDEVAPEALAEKVDPLEVLRSEGIECLTGELLLVKLQNASLEGLHGKMVPGVLIMTTYKLLLIPHRAAQRGMSAQGIGTGADERYFAFGHLPREYLQVPMTYIDKVERDSDRKGAPRVDRYFNGDAAVTIHCKDARRLRLSFGGPEESERAMKMLQQLAFPGQQMEHLFAFSHRTLDGGLPDPGWHIYDPQKEFDRMGVLTPKRNGSTPWRTTDLNNKYELCASYPSVLVVPSSVTDEDVMTVSQFRSEQRLPVLCWGRQADAASIWRSSQPKIGMSRATCAEDEDMLGRLAASSPSRILPIVDCRPRSNATANFAAGYGYESYADCPLEFSGIGNIHVMRESLAKLEGLCLGTSAKDQDWTAVVEDTRWLSHVRNVLSSAWTVAFKAHTQRTPVLVHCSHGWDRTSQVCSLAEMLLDPYYRTVDGFQVLIEKDWLAFGHPFHLRHAYGLPRGATSAKEDQRSPIFLQFLDCTWQLVMQLPSYFEFNPRYLLCIADHIQSCRFGTFLCNTNKARKNHLLEQRCGSLWTFLELHRNSFLSKLYDSDTQEELLPPLPSILRHVRLWSDYFLRWSPAASFLPLPPALQGVESGSGGGSTANGEKDPRTASGGKPSAQQPGDALAEKGSSGSLPVFRCEFDEMEQWVTLYGREADRWRRKVIGGGDGETTRGSPRWTGETTSRPGSVQAESKDLAAALKEIERLKAALEEKDELVGVLLMAKSTPKKPKAPKPRTQTAPSKSVSSRRSNRGADTTTTSRTHGRTANSATAAATTVTTATTAAAAAAELDADAFDAELDADDGEGWSEIMRPRVQSSSLEGREARRTSLNEMGVEEDRERCVSGSTGADTRYDGRPGAGYLGDVLRNDQGQGSRTNSSWKWEFSGWSVTGSGSKGSRAAAANGAVLGRKPRPKK